MPGRIEPTTLLTEIDDLKRRLRNLESAPQAPNSSITAGALSVRDGDRNQILRYGLQDDGTYALAVFDDDNNERARFGELAAGGYGSKLSLDIAADNNTVIRNVSGTGDPTTGSAGPQVTVATGTRAIVIVCALASVLSGTAVATYSISGATTSAGDASGDRYASIAAPNPTAASIARVCLQTGLNPGNNTFKMQYDTGGSVTKEFSYRSITVIPL